MARIELEHIDKIYPNGHVASRDLCVDIADGELLVLVGPSGCGKSTALRLIAGLESPTAGRIRIAGKDVTHLPPQVRDLAMVFQSYALYPHMTVKENLSFGLKIRKETADEIETRVDKAANALGLADFLDRKPAQLSGGQRQRVALGRAIVREPHAFLFDEPLSNLDAKLRIETRAELARLHRRLAATMVYVTHDQEEAMTLGDRVAVLKDGVLQQVAPPMELYLQPANRFVAGFIGSPAMNLFEGALQQDGDDWSFVGSSFSIPIDRPIDVPADGRVELGIRPQDVQIQSSIDGSRTIGVQVAVIEPIGSQQIVHCVLAQGETLLAVSPIDPDLKVDSTAAVRIPRQATHLFAATSGTRLQNRA